jgi:hypothetical protein
MSISGRKSFIFSSSADDDILFCSFYFSSYQSSFVWVCITLGQHQRGDIVRMMGYHGKREGYDARPILNRVQFSLLSAWCVPIACCLSLSSPHSLSSLSSPFHLFDGLSLSFCLTQEYYLATRRPSQKRWHMWKTQGKKTVESISPVYKDSREVVGYCQAWEIWIWYAVINKRQNQEVLS